MEPFPEWSPFFTKDISSHESLRNCTERYRCPGCNYSRKYFCYKCYTVSPYLTVPVVKLPVRLTIIKDSRELEGKSTAVHAKVLAADQVEIVPSTSFSSIDNSVLLFPSDDSVLPDQIDWSQVSRVLVIEGTWSQAMSINKTLPASITRVTLPPSRTAFWRYQQLGEHCLSTIEAIYSLFQCVAGNESSNIDNILWFFSFQYHLIQQLYKEEENKVFTSRHRPGYIIDRK